MSTASSTALITGASSGIGAVYADRLAAQGHNLILVARRADRLQALAQQLTERFAVTVTLLVADLSAEAGINAVENELRNNEVITLLVNNAGAAHMASFLDSSAQAHQDIITLNITALTRLSLAALPRFKARNAGTIINIASTLSIHARGETALYSGTKAFVLNFSRGLQAEFAQSGVRIQVVMPSITATEIWGHSGIAHAQLPEGTVMTSEDMVDAALAGLAQGENITIPPLHDMALWERYEEARLAVFGASRTGVPAPRYGK
ncbi:SDR family NAD(P)-dependent oxidoreductase [Atlantibacter subterraneus]|uniref:SDR family NAD(P)-dependent oxidoreductase n=1 Tax=Atlantibacter subterraneus TaxID=255519 RepID=UPI0028A60853|nr:SDR family oxidoreductase [Atlantibacter subterranea]